jgi:hypothetical protein
MRIRIWHPRKRLDDETGAYAILFAILIVAILSIAAVAVDLSSQMAYAGDNRSRADFAALAAGSKLPGDPLGACNEAWKFIRANTRDLPATAVSPCASGVPQAFNPVCTATTPAVVYQATNTGPTYQISITYPVPNSDPSMLGRVGPGTVDGLDSERCQRMAVSVRSSHATIFGGILKSGRLSSPATAVVRARLQGFTKVPVALLILDPYGCNALTNSGQAAAYVYAADVNNPGFISLDSDGTKIGNPNRCDQANQFTVDVSGTGNANIKACANTFDPLNPTSCTDPGTIDLYSFASGQTTCSNGNPVACDPTDVNNGTLYPQPIQEFYRATVLPAYRRWNCRGTGVGVLPYRQYAPYPSPLLPVSIGQCDHTDTNDSAAPYIDNLNTTIGQSGIPTGFCNLNAKPANGCPTVPGYATKGVSCGLSSSDPAVNVPAGNWDITCKGGMSISTNVTFATGSNVVVDDGLSTGANNGSVSLNAVTPGTCDAAQPNVYMFFRGSGGFSKGAQSSMTLCHTMVYLTGAKPNGNSTPPTLDFGAGSGSLTWVAPSSGPFNGLALWSEGAGGNFPHNIGGQASLVLQGVFFMPYADPFTFTGQGALYQTQAQFVTFRMNIAGQGTLTMVPSPSNALTIPKYGWALIR